MEEVKKCKVCESITKVCNTDIGLLCGKHYLQYKRHGKVQLRTKFDPNEVIEHENYCEVVLYDKDNAEKCRTLIDLEDRQLIENKKWCCNKDGYVISGSVKPFIYLHRLVMSAQSCDYVDHINGNTLDNRRHNLRLCTNTENLQNRVTIPINNTSGILGVRYRADRNKWYAEIQYNKQRISLGSYTEREDAIKARLDAEIKYFGKYKSQVINNEVN